MEQDDIRRENGALNRALADAAAHGDALVVGELLDAGADIHFAGDQAIILAAQEGHTETVKVLLKAGADPTHRVTSSNAWYQAAMKGHKDTVKALFEWEDRQTEPAPTPGQS